MIAFSKFQELGIKQLAPFSLFLVLLSIPVFVYALNIIGTDNDDILFGDTANNTIQGKKGNDTIYGGGGNDRLEGDEGDDTLKADSGSDQLYGGPGNDRLEGGAGNDMLRGGEGDDTIRGGDGNDTLYGEEGEDTLKGDAGDDIIWAWTGDEIDWLYGGDGNDFLHGNDGDDQLRGDGGDDLLTGGGGNDNLIGHDGNDALYGQRGDDALYGYSGSDVLHGGEGADRLIGGDDADRFEFRVHDIDGNYDRLEDFDLSEGDQIDISLMSLTYSEHTDDIADFVQLILVGNEVEVHVDRDGLGSALTAEHIATIYGAPGTTLGDLIGNDALFIGGNIEYPCAPNPTLQEEKLMASDAQANNHFGWDTAISSDGNTAVVAAHTEGTGGPGAGAAYIFIRSGGMWAEQAKILSDDVEAQDNFGSSVALSADGNTVIVGARREDAGGTNAGAAYVFTRSGGVWTQQAKILSDDIQTQDNFGASVSLSSDGNTAIVGANRETTGGASAGAAYVFTRSAGIWTQQAKIQSDDIQGGDSFGFAVSLSSEGDTAIVGSISEDTGGSSAGATYVFTRSGGIWTEQAKIQGSDTEAGDNFGSSVALSSDGDTAIVGSTYEDTGGTSAGSAYVFTRSGGIWTEQAKIQSDDIETDDLFGLSVALSADGTTAIMGAYGEDTVGSRAGSAYVFTHSGGIWSQQSKIQPDDIEAEDFFGYSVSLSGDGITAMVGSVQEDTGGLNAGAAYVFYQ